MKNLGYYITKDKPDVKILLEPQEIIYLDNMNLIELVLPKCRVIWCDRNHLTELILHKSCQIVRYSNNNYR